MSEKENFQIEALKIIISYHSGHLLKTEEMSEVVKQMVADAEAAMEVRIMKEDDCFDGWLDRQASDRSM